MRFNPRGLDAIREWVLLFPKIPVIAIGGLREDHIKPIKQLGASGVAVISGILATHDPVKSYRSWQTAWNIA